jgi:hypothetical protein
VLASRDRTRILEDVNWMHAPESADASRGRIAQARERVEAVRAWAERTFLWRIWERLLENEFLERSVALGAKAFVSFFPALIVVASFTPPSVRASIYEVIARRSGVRGNSTEVWRDAFATSDSVRRATGFVGLVFTFFYINSFTSALTRVYTRAWRRPTASRITGYGVGAGWLVGIIVYFSIIGGLRAALGSGPRTALFALLAWIAAMGLWWLTSWIMLHRQVRLRVLAATGVLTGTGLVAYGAAASLWVPRAAASNQAQFGFFGVALTLVTLLTGVAIIIVFGACAAPVLAEDTGVVGRLIRGSNNAILSEGAPPSLPAPIYAPSLMNAIRRRPGTNQSEEPTPAADPRLTPPG